MRPVKVASKLLYETSAVSLFARLPDAHTTSGSRHCRSHIMLMVTLACSFVLLFEEEKDCSQSNSRVDPDYFDNVMTTFTVSHRTDTLKTDINLFLMIIVKLSALTC